METADPTVVTLLALAAAYGMVVLGIGKRKLVWRRRCRVLRGWSLPGDVLCGWCLDVASPPDTGGDEAPASLRK